MKPITPQQFAALIALTSVQPGSKTHQALERHLVIGFAKSDAAMMSGIKPQVLNSALRNVRAAAARAREFVALTPAETAAATPELRCAPSGGPGSLS